MERVLDARSTPLWLLVALLFGKYVFTAVCFGSGAPGGTLLPLVVMGAMVGAIFGLEAIGVAHVSGAYENSFIVLGIAGMLAAVIQAPVTAVVLVFELTGSLEALLATSITALIAYVVSTLLGCEPFYEHLYAKLIGGLDAKDGTRYGKREKLLRSYTVGVGSRIEGRLVREVPWPKDVLLVTIHHGDTEVVAKGDVPLAAFDEILVLMSAEHEYDSSNAVKELCMPGG